MTAPSLTPRKTPAPAPQTEAEWAERLRDPWWRITSGVLYKIMVKGDDADEDEMGELMPFIPNANQIAFLQGLHHRNVVLKARQLGFTTLAAIMALDHAMFVPNQRCGIIAHEMEVAAEILRDKVLLAYENLPEAVRLSVPLKKQTEKQIIFQHNNSSVRVATSMRGGTIHFLHISEMGKIAAKYPAKAAEIVTGSLPAVPKSAIATIESTAEGQEGEFFDIAKRAENLAMSKSPLLRKNFKFHFFPWFLEPGYVEDPKNVKISAKQHEYFDNLEAKVGRNITMAQRAWYVLFMENEFSGNQQRMFQEMPSCVVGETRVSTPSGIIPIKDIAPDGDQITHHYDQGLKPVFEIVTERGYSLTCTDDHPILCADGEFRKLADDLGIGARLQMAPPTFGDEVQTVTHRPYPFVSAEIAIDARFGEFLGLFMGDGSFSHDQLEICCDGQDADVVEHVRDMLNDIFGRSTTRTIGNKSGGIGVRFASKGVREYLFALDAIEARDAGGVKRKVHVPSYIMQSPKPVVSAFLRGLFEADGHVHVRGTNTRFFAKSLPFIRDVQILLLGFGIESRIKQVEKTNGAGYTYTGCEMFIGAEGTRKFHREIGFISQRKRDRIALSVGKKATNPPKPFDFTEAIASITPKGSQQVYDITTKTARFNAGGIIVHNCPEEAWSRSTEGTYLTPQLDAARKQGRICKVPHRAGLPVHTFWDIGGADGTGIWMGQQVGMSMHMLAYIEDWSKGYEDYVKAIEAKGWVLGDNYLPHDAAQERPGEKGMWSPMTLLTRLRPRWSWRLVPRIHDFQAGITALRQRFPELWFDEEGCKEGLQHLSLYRKKFNTRLGTFVDEPEKHDGHSEAPDALRQWAQGFEPSHVVPGRQRRSRPRATGMTA